MESGLNMEELTYIYFSVSFSYFCNPRHFSTLIFYHLFFFLMLQLYEAEMQRELVPFEGLTITHCKLGVF